MPSKDQVLIYTAYLVIAAVVISGGIYIYQKYYPANKNNKEIYPEPEFIKSIRGRIISVDGNILKLETAFAEKDPANPKIVVYEFTVADQTKIIKRTIKSEAELQILKPEEMPFNEIFVTVQDLRPDMIVQVDSIEDLKNIAKATAVQIVIME